MKQILKHWLAQLFPPTDRAARLVHPPMVGLVLDHEGQAHRLVLYMFLACSYCQRVLIVIERHRIPVSYRETHLNPGFRAELLALTGKTRVPCLFVDEQPLYESTAIIDYLERNFVRNEPLSGA